VAGGTAVVVVVSDAVVVVSGAVVVTTGAVVVVGATVVEVVVVVFASVVVVVVGLHHGISNVFGSGTQQSKVRVSRQSIVESASDAPMNRNPPASRHVAARRASSRLMVELIAVITILVVSLRYGLSTLRRADLQGLLSTLRSPSLPEGERRRRGASRAESQRGEPESHVHSHR
jgi:hypothetical protein